MVPQTFTTSQWSKLHTAKNRKHLVSARNKKETQTNVNADGGISLIRQCLISAGLPEHSADIIMQSWRPTTKKQYGSYFRRWVQFCGRTQTDKINPSLVDIVAFLTQMHDDALSYSAINTAKSMLSSIFEIIHKRDIGKEVLIKRFMKGIFHLHPSLPKTIFTWNIKDVLKFLATMENSNLTMRLLSVKLAILMVLTTGQR